MSDSRTSALAARRLVAFGVDSLLMLGWIGLLALVGSRVRSASGLRVGPVLTARHKWTGHALSLVTLTLPVTLAFAVAEWSPWQATPGKRLLGLRVERLNGGRLSFGHSLRRSSLKFAPWEVAHSVIWHSPGQPFVSPPAAWGMTGYGLSLAAGLWYVGSLFRGAGRPPYDRLAGSRVRGRRTR